MAPQQLVFPKRRTKIVCTLGPATEDPAALKALMLAGMDLVRVNCSHGTVAERLEMVARVRAVAAELNAFIPIMFDLQGPKIRVGDLREPFQLVKGERLTISAGDGMGEKGHVTTIYERFARDVKPGEPVLIDDGKIHLRVDEIIGDSVHCYVVVGGLLKPRKGINLPNTSISAPCLSTKDKNDLATAIANDIDFVAVSFVRTASDMVAVRREAQDIGEHHLQFISKIERPEAVADLIPIVNTSDGVMVARGDLGVEMGSHKVPMLQKEIISRANLAGKFVITATQMLESMVELPVPTRAEASDVANAILDGTDACMLSAETAVGAYPSQAVEMIAKIAWEAESSSVHRYRSPEVRRGSVHHIPDGISLAACDIARHMGARLLMSFTNSGSSALRLSKKHPHTLIVAATIHEHIARRLRAYWGVIPVLIRQPASVEEMFEEVRARIIELKLVREGDIAILTSGYPLWTTGSTNLLRVMQL